jgi:hypothetical protein
VGTAPADVNPVGAVVTRALSWGGSVRWDNQRDLYYVTGHVARGRDAGFTDLMDV